MTTRLRLSTDRARLSHDAFQRGSDLRRGVLAWFERRATERKAWPEQKPAVPGPSFGPAAAHRVEAILHSPFSLLPGRGPGNCQSAVLYGFEVKYRETQVKAFAHVVAGCSPPSTIARCNVCIATKARFAHRRTLTAINGRASISRCEQLISTATTAMAEAKVPRII
jgi:cation diffusion facilitator CzcD-associated flavoprotein CzcO